VSNFYLEHFSGIKDNTANVNGWRYGRGIRNFLSVAAAAAAASSSFTSRSRGHKRARRMLHTIRYNIIIHLYRTYIFFHTYLRAHTTYRIRIRVRCKCDTGNARGKPENVFNIIRRVYIYICVYNVYERIYVLYKNGDGKHCDVITVAAAAVVVCKNNEVLFCSPLLGRVCFFVRYSCACVCLFRLTDCIESACPLLHCHTLTLSLSSLPVFFSSFVVRGPPERRATFPLLVS